MHIEWSAFWSSLLGTTVPGLVISLLLLWLNHRNAKALESQKTTFAAQLAGLQHELTTQGAQFTFWHQKRVAALVEIYDAFRNYLDFLRRALYIPGSRGSLDPYFDFRKLIDQNLVFLDDELQQRLNGMHVELLQFWNWAQQQERGVGITGDAVQQRLDFEIPGVLERLRREINSYADPLYRATSS
jgi:hypothetical protein